MTKLTCLAMKSFDYSQTKRWVVVAALVTTSSSNLWPSHPTVSSLPAKSYAQTQSEQIGGVKGRTPTPARDEGAALRPELDLPRNPEYDYTPPTPGSYILPVLEAAANGAVLNAQGKTAQLHDLFRNRIVVLSFIYTRCTDPRACLRASGVLRQLQSLSRSSPELGRKLLLVTLSFDPAYDTPSVIGRYGQVFDTAHGGADWLFLTTRSQADLQPILAAYDQRVDKRKRAGALGPYYHPLRVYLIDANLQIRNIYSYGLLDPRLVMTDVRTLELEGPNTDSRTAQIK